ncbi:MAG: cytidine deaminase [Lachnospiraceae bacterium]|nr:cytidine deaminase [Lachnospiraceae bacterium]
MTGEERERLIGLALAARENAYAPYSGYAVGAALLTADGRIFQGCNVENASYSATNCAERTAIYKAVSEGVRDFVALAVAGGRIGCAPTDYAYPCGICRQVMQEFCTKEFQIFAAISGSDYKAFSLGELLPYGFGGEQIQ